MNFILIFRHEIITFFRYSDIYDKAVHELQALLADGEACVIKEIGYEKFRYLNSVVSIITKDDYQCLDFDSFVSAKVQYMLNNSNYIVDLTY